MTRRQFLEQSTAAGATFAAAVAVTGCSLIPARDRKPVSVLEAFELEEMGLAEMQQGMASQRFTAAGLVERYLKRIESVDRNGPRLNSVIELNPDAPAIAEALDRERKASGPRGPLHGVPVLIKDNIGTHDRMTTTAGSLALLGSIPPKDSFVVERMRAAGAVILGKTNLSEWANFRGSRSISGWSGRGGQTRNPYVLDRNPSGSSSGSAAAVSANLCAVAVGTETNGSIVSPSSYCGIVGLKPTVGLVSRAGIIPISASQDTAGPMARTVADAAALLGAMTGVDPGDAATAASRGRPVSDYTRMLDGNALRGARIGLVRSQFKLHRRVDPVLEEALEVIEGAGADLVELPKLPSRQELNGADYQVMVYEFKAGLNAYLASLGERAPIKNMEELIDFNERNRDRDLPYFGQEILIEAQAKGPLTDQGYLDARERCAKWSAGLHAVLAENRLDAIAAPTSGPAHALDWIHGDRGIGGSSTYAAVAGFPNITVPCGAVFNLPVGMSFFGRAWTEQRLLALAYSFEQAIKARRTPRFLPTLETA
jgi:amidase